MKKAHLLLLGMLVSSGNNGMMVEFFGEFHAAERFCQIWGFKYLRDRGLNLIAVG